MRNRGEGFEKKEMTVRHFYDGNCGDHRPSAVKPCVTS